MSKVITSPSKRWAGTVTLADPLTLAHVEAIEQALEIQTDGERVYLSVIDKRNLPAVFACVEKWDLGNFPEAVTLDTFPMSPRKASHDLVQWLWNELMKVYVGEQDIPNA